VDDYRDFVNRYEQGSPHEGYWMKKFPAATSKYRQMPSDLYQESAQEAFSRMSPQGACSLVNIFGSKRVSKLQFPDPDQDGQDRFQDPNYLAQVTYPPAAARYAWSVNGRCRRVMGGRRR